MKNAISTRTGMALLAAVLAFAAPDQADAQDASKVYTLAEVTTQPQIKSQNAAAQAINRNYPEQMRSIGGRVQLRFVVQPDGKVDPASIEVLVASANTLGEAAVKAVQQIDFSPGQVNGVPVKSQVIFPIIFAAR